MVIKTAIKQEEDLDLLCNSLDAQAGRFLYYDLTLYNYLLRAQAAIDSLRKMLESERENKEAKTGYWIDSAGHDKCSICGAEYSDLYPDYSNTHFCPNCGAKMKQESR